MGLFEKVFLEAPEDPPDMGQIGDDAPADTGPPPDGGGPPDMGAMNNAGDPGAPPDMGEFGDDDNYGDENDYGDYPEEDNELTFDDKISAIMNQRLYDRFIKLNKNLKSQINIFNNNIDIIDSISDKIETILSSMIRLNENITTYMSEYFISTNYSKNLLFFNKCLNLYNMLQQSFDKEVKKYKDVEN